MALKPIATNSGRFEIDQLDVSELTWTLGYLQGLREGMGRGETKPISPEDLAPVETRIKKVLGGEPYGTDKG